MAAVMLDTNVCIDVMRRRGSEMRRRLERSRPGEVAVSSIAAAELWTGVSKSREAARAGHAVREFFGYVTVLDWPAEAAPVYGRLRANLEQSGRMIGAMDLLIASHAVHEDIPLITRNRREFDRVAGLRLESWDE